MKLYAIPNWFTLGNLLSGCVGILSAVHGDLITTAICVGIAAVMDFLDGMVARLTKQSSPIGKDLDSLADMVSFGVLPGFVLFELMMNRSNIFDHHDMSDLAFREGVLVDHVLKTQGVTALLLPFTAFVLTLFSALRLAKFNNDSRQSDSFIGVPTPAVTMFVASLPLLLHRPIPGHGNHWMLFEEKTKPLHHAGKILTEKLTPFQASLEQFLLHPATLVSLVAVLSFLLVSEIPLFSLKFKKFGWRGNEIRYGFLLFCLAIIVLMPRAAFPLIIPMYVLVSVVNNLLTKKPVSGSEKNS